MLFKMSQMTGLKLVHFMAIWYLGISLFIRKYDSAKKMNHECHKPGVILDLDLFGLYSLNIRKSNSQTICLRTRPVLHRQRILLNLGKMGSIY